MSEVQVPETGAAGPNLGLRSKSPGETNSTREWGFERITTCGRGFETLEGHETLSLNDRLSTEAREFTN